MPLPAHISHSPSSFLSGQCRCPLISPNLLLLPFQGNAITRSFLPISCFFPSRAMLLPAHFSQSPASSLPGQCHCPLISSNLLLLPFQGYAIARSFLPFSFFPSRAMLLPAHFSHSPASFLPRQCHYPLISPILLLLSFQGYAIARSFLPFSFFFPSRAMPCPLISPNLLLLPFLGNAVARSFLPISCFFPSRAMPLPAHFSQSPASSVPGQCHCPLISPNLLLLPFQGNAIARSYLPFSFFFPFRAMPLPAHFSQSPSSFLPGQCHCPLISSNLLLLPFQGNAIARSPFHSLSSLPDASDASLHKYPQRPEIYHLKSNFFHFFAKIMRTG